MGPPRTEEEHPDEVARRIGREVANAAE